MGAVSVLVRTDIGLICSLGSLGNCCGMCVSAMERGEWMGGWGANRVSCSSADDSASTRARSERVMCTGGSGGAATRSRQANRVHRSDVRPACERIYGTRASPLSVCVYVR